MTDSLRTRIAAVVADYHQRWGMRCECGADHAHADGLADAVIRELKLEREYGYHYWAPQQIPLDHLPRSPLRHRMDRR